MEAKKNSINPNIEGYDFVKNCTRAGGYERCRCDFLFVVERNVDEDYFERLRAVALNENGNYDRLRQQFPSDGYIIWWGTIWNEEIMFYWS